MYVNNKETPFQDRRTREWTSSNWRPRSQWQNLERQRETGQIKAQLIRDRNRSLVYQQDKENIVKQYENIIDQLDKKSQNSEENLKQLDQISLKNPSELERVPTSKRSHRIKTQRSNKDELFTTEEVKQLKQLPRDEREKILSLGNKKMIKYWDGYKYKYSPTKIREASPQKAAPRVDFEVEVIQPEIIHYSKPNGYRHVWPDATKANNGRIQL